LTLVRAYTLHKRACRLCSSDNRGQKLCGRAQVVLVGLKKDIYVAFCILFDQIGP
jgi:hypothetical protein